MPDNKNQHYVPRCHLKPFSLKGEGLAIHLFNHRRGIIRRDVPISGQCSKSYFYGQDLVLEKHLQSFEGIYATIVRAVESGEVLSEAKLNLLRDVVLLQWSRTDAALKRRAEAMQLMENLAFDGHEHLKGNSPQAVADMSHDAMIKGMMQVWVGSLDTIKDLKTIILRNRSVEDFLTSDDPAVLTNRVYQQRMKDNNFGLMNTGTMMVMPLGPRFAAVIYDADSYSANGRTGHYLDVSRVADVRAMNELQFLNSQSNIYFAGRFDRSDAIQAAFASVADRRLASRYNFWHGISEGIEGDFEVFRRLAVGEKFDIKATRINSLSPLYPAPAHWLSVMPMRSRLVGWENGSSVGPVRITAVGNRTGFRPVVIGFGPRPNRGGQLPDRMYHYLKREDTRSDKRPMRGSTLTAGRSNVRTR